MKECKKCGAISEDYAEKCPSCSSVLGEQRWEQLRGRKKWPLKFVVQMVVIGVACLLALLVIGETKKTTQAPDKPLTDIERIKMVCDYYHNKKIADLTHADLDKIKTCRAAGLW